MRIATRKPGWALIRICAMLLGILAAACPVNAASITIKGNTITFTEPEGFVNLDGGKYQSVADRYRAELDTSLTATHLYYSGEDIAAFDAGKEGPGKFIAVTAYQGYAFVPFFGIYKKELRKMHDRSGKEAGDPGGLEPEFFNETATDISVFIPRAGAPEDKGYYVASTATHMLRENRLFIVVQYANHRDDHRLRQFREEAETRLQAMNFPPPEEKHAFAWVFPVAAASLLAVLCALAYGFFRFRLRKG